MTGALSAGVTTARLNAAIAIVQPHLRPILTAVRDHKVGMLFAPQGPGAFSVPKTARAAVVIIGDDLECSLGPTGFHRASVRRAIRACSAFAVVTCEPTPAIYGTAAAIAVAGKDVAIIETRLEHEFQWVELIQKLAPGKPLLLATVKGGAA